MSLANLDAFLGLDPVSVLSSTLAQHRLFLDSPSIGIMSDPTTQSNYHQIETIHAAFEWAVDFASQVISGSVTHSLRVKEDGVKEVIFDTLDLNIKDVQVEGNAVSYEVKPKHAVMGSALHIPLASDLKANSNVEVKISYATTPSSTALGWLDKDQTQGKQFPYLFSQCQPIYARSLAPLQDTPSVKITYEAGVSSNLPVLMSAIRQSPPSEGPAHDGKVIGKDVVVYTYSQPVPIPTYLIAIAVGNVRYRAFETPKGRAWKSGIWAEPEFIDAAYWEFSKDTARFVATEEDIVTPYRFGVYDLLVLPPSFPYGGMENACLTFLTPTLLTGDRTLVDVVAHEATHSWFGNGVTHAYASHFWLNEGWTTYIERLLLQIIYSPAERGFSFLIGYKSLVDDLTRYESRPNYQRLVPEFEYGEDPDDAYSNIPYEKGANLILHLERTLGGLDIFLPYVKDYVSTYMGKSITTDQWKSHLYDYYRRNGGEEKVKALDSVNWDAWLHGEGIELPVKMEYDTTLAKQAYELADRWNASRSLDVSKLNFKDSDISDFNGNQNVVFLERLHLTDPLPPSHVSHLGKLYRFSTSNNAEIRSRFYELALLNPSASFSPYPEEAIKWVTGEDGTGVVKGRMKFCRTLFKAVFKADQKLAVDTFKRTRQYFHPIAAKMIERDLQLA